MNNNDSDYCKNCGCPLLYPDKPCPKCEPIQTIELIEKENKKFKITKSPILLGILVILTEYFFLPRVVPHGKTFIASYFIILSIFIASIGILYSLIYNESMTSKYYKRYAITVFFPPIMLTALLILAIIYFSFIPGANNPGLGWGLTFAIIGIIVLYIVALHNFIVLFISNFSSSTLIKFLNKQ